MPKNRMIFKTIENELQIIYNKGDTVKIIFCSPSGKYTINICVLSLWDLLKSGLIRTIPEDSSVYPRGLARRVFEAKATNNASYTYINNEKEQSNES